MQTTPAEKIAEYSAKGWWGTRTISDIFGEALAAAPDRIALVDPVNRSALTFGEPVRLTYRQLDLQIAQIAAELFDAGIRSDDIVVVQLPNTFEIVATYLALARLGAIISPVPMQYGRFELTHIAKTLHPRAFLSLSHFKGQNLAADHRGGFPQDTTILAFGPSTGDGITPLGQAPTAEAMAKSRSYIQGLNPSANDIFTICWTSGTTGRPKGVPRSHNHWINPMISCRDSVSLNDGDALLNPFPFVNMASIGGFLFVWLDIKGKLVLHHPFEHQVFLQQLEQEEIVYTIAPPAVLTHLIQTPEIFDKFDIHMLRFIMSGSAPLAPSMVKSYSDRLDIDIINAFGSNEGITLLSCGRDVPDPEDRALFFPRFGRPEFEWENGVSSRMQSKLKDRNSGAEITEPGIEGELCLNGPGIFDGYYQSAKDNAEVFDTDGFFHTGDLFEITGDRNQFYRFVGRCKDIIVRGGMNISPEELDNALADHPDLIEAAVAGYADEILGEKVAVAAVPKEGVALTLGSITDHLRAKDIAVFKLPERLLVLEKLPRNPLNKVIRSELATSLAEDRK